MSLLKLCSGLALFLYGMNLMSDSLMHIAGERIKYLLGRIASDRLAAIIFGALVTALIQSSSATTVMTVGLVEAGILKLSDSAAIIMGANVGTTITSWLFAATGISANGDWLILLKPENIVAIPALIGVILILVSHDYRYTEIGKSILGFTILIYGMEMMTSAVSPLADNPGFGELLTLCNNPIYGVLAGTFITAVIQSSSASVGILQALCLSGNISYDAAIPIIMGQNIGTCVTTIIASFGTSINAKRSAVFHLYFNIIGTVLFILLYYVLKITGLLSLYDMYATSSGIAFVHSIFNIASVVLMYPFTDLLVNVTIRTIKNK